MKRFWILFLFFFGFDLSVALAHPIGKDSLSFQSKKDTLLPVQNLKEVVIQSLSIQKKDIHSPTPVQTINQQDLQRMNSLSVADAVRFFSGIQLKDYGGIGGLKTLNVRSMGTHHTTVFYDGMPLGNAQNGQVDLGKLSIHNLEEIKLYNTQSNDIFQPAKAFASGATLYLTSGRPNFSEKKNTHLQFGFKTGSFGLVNPNIEWEQKISPHLSSRISVDYQHANGRYPFHFKHNNYDTTAIRQNADITAWRLNAGLYGTFSDSSQWSIQAYHYQSERGLPGATVANHFNHYQRLWNTDQFIQAQWEKKISKRYTFKANTKYTKQKTKYLDPFYPNNAGRLENHYKEKDFYASLANQLKWTSFFDMDISIDYHWDHLQSDIYHFSFPTRQTILGAIAGKLHFPHWIVEGSLLETFVQDRVRINKGRQKKSELTPSLSTSWQPFHQIGLWLRGSYKKLFRMPTFNDLYYTLVGNIYLKPEFVTQYNAGFTYHKSFERGIWKYMALSVDGYHNRVTDKIIATPGSNLFRWTMSNFGKVDIKGVDVTLDNQFFIRQQFLIKIGLNYTFQNSLDVTSQGFHYKNEIPYAPKHSGAVTASLDWKNWGINYSFIYTGERYSQLSNSYKDYIPAWYTHDVSLEKQWNLKKISLKVFGEINNIANQHYNVIKNFPMPGRSFRLGFSIHYL